MMVKSGTPLWIQTLKRERIRATVRPASSTITMVAVDSIATVIRLTTEACGTSCTQPCIPLYTNTHIIQRTKCVHRLSAWVLRVEPSSLKGVGFVERFQEARLQVRSRPVQCSAVLKSRLKNKGSCLYRIHLLKFKDKVVRVKNAAQANTYIGAPKLVGIIVTGACMADQKNYSKRLCQMRRFSWCAYSLGILD